MLQHPRIKSTLRVLSHYHWVRAQGEWAGVDLIDPQGRLVGALSGVQIGAGQAAVQGVSPAPLLRFMTERATVQVVPGPGGQFTAQLEGTQFLAWSADLGADPVPLRLYRPWHRLLHLGRTLWSLAGFPIRHSRDLLAFFLRGDSAAGDRLERALLPLMHSDAIPQAATPLFGAAGLPEQRAAVDIILPVFNAADVLRECLDHLHRHTDAPHRVILIDDGSTDPAIRPMLGRFVALHPQARLVVNDVNLGFVGTVNRGLGMAGGDVVLLNSDAMVPDGWLPRLMAPIRADATIATVTPMSNDAEIFSAPVECRASTLAAGQAAAADRAAQAMNWHIARADAPTGVGFCMAMSRGWLARFPTLDPVFGRGYGEEVDWCRRTAQAGARHIGLGTVFVEHRSGSSFGAEKADRVRRNNAIISDRYPGYDAMVARFRQTDPLVGPRLAIGLALIDRGDPVPVYLAHRLGGGAEMWLQDAVARDVAAGGGAVVLRDDPETGGLLVAVHAASGRTEGVMARDDVIPFLNVAGRRRLIYSCLVGATDPVGLLQRLVAAQRPQDGLSVLFHDFLPLCPSYNLISDQGRFCGLPGAAACQSCYSRLAVTSGQRPATIADWRNAWRGILGQADDLVVFSDDSRAQVLAIWPALAARIRVRPHALTEIPRPVAVSDHAKVTVGVLGGIGYCKGAAVLQALSAATGPDFGVVVIGKIDPAFAAPSLVVHGAYTRDKISDLAEHYRITCWLIPSIWPETFSYAVHECLATGLPVYGFDLGAQGAALRAAPNGRVLDPQVPIESRVFRARAGHPVVPAQ
jgi:O-antigen biosynthesis protein